MASRFRCYEVEHVTGGYRLAGHADSPVCTYEEIEAGAMFYADDDWARAVGYIGPDGRCLVVKTPDGFWYVDSRASNCGRPEDRVHKCWVRHGSIPDITVDKNGDTCSAGAGSIQCGSYHGFLRNGWLEEC